MRAVVKADPLTITGEVAKALSAKHSTVIQHLKQIGKVKKLSKWVPHVRSKNLKNHHFVALSFLTLCNNKEQFLDQIVTCDEKWILHNKWQQQAQWLDREEAMRHFP